MESHDDENIAIRGKTYQRRWCRLMQLNTYSPLTYDHWNRRLQWMHSDSHTAKVGVGRIPDPWDRIWDLTGRSPSDVIKDVVNRYEADEFCVSFSGAEDVVLIDIATRICTETIHVFTLDTGRLHEETYAFIETVRNRYDIDLHVLSPDANAVNKLVRAKGLFSFYQDGHTECCGIRKIMPLERHLQHYDAWITGQRRDQGTTRSAVPYLQEDKAFSTVEHSIMKYNPLAAWDANDVWAYIHANDVPANPLHEKGFPSIGCAPCTRAVKPGESDRSGRWWWEHEDDKECGIHLPRPETQPVKLR